MKPAALVEERIHVRNRRYNNTVEGRFCLGLTYMAGCTAEGLACSDASARRTGATRLRDGEASPASLASGEDMFLVNSTLNDPLLPAVDKEAMTAEAADRRDGDDDDVMVCDDSDAGDVAALDSPDAFVCTSQPS